MKMKLILLVVALTAFVAASPYHDYEDQEGVQDSDVEVEETRRVIRDNSNQNRNEKETGIKPKNKSDPKRKTGVIYNSETSNIETHKSKNSQRSDKNNKAGQNNQSKYRKIAGNNKKMSNGKDSEPAGNSKPIHKKIKVPEQIANEEKVQNFVSSITNLKVDVPFDANTELSDQKLRDVLMADPRGIPSQISSAGVSMHLDKDNSKAEGMESLDAAVKKAQDYIKSSIGTSDTIGVKSLEMVAKNTP